MAICDENISIGCNRYSRRHIESVRAVARNSRLAKCDQDFSHRAELEDLVPFPAAPYPSVTHTFPSLSAVIP